MAGSPKFHEMLKKMADIHDRKNANYSPGDSPFKNFRECEDLDIPDWKGVLVRLSDKWARAKALAKGVPDMVGEDLEDTLIDMANYAIIALVLYKEKMEKPGK